MPTHSMYMMMRHRSDLTSIYELNQILIYEDATQDLHMAMYFSIHEIFPLNCLVIPLKSFQVPEFFINSA